MNIPQHRSDDLAEQILDAFPSGSYALAGLLRLLDIVATDRVPTAAVECLAQPRLLINPGFVRDHAATPEKLLMLVMHELHHVLLGHTTLFPRTMPVHNFVFDAVINGIVCRMFPRPEYTAFFTDFYSDERFPECLLRPPPGWPGKTRPPTPALLALPEAQAARIREVHAALYSKAGASYHEVYELLPKALAGGDADPAGGYITDVPLLGGHGDETIADGQLERHSPLLFDIVRELVEDWPQPPDPIKGRSLADVLSSTTLTPQRMPSNRAMLRGLICKVAGSDGAGRIRRLGEDQAEAMSPIPVLSRRSVVLHALGTTPVLYPVQVAWPRRIPTGAQVHVYIDVSGSMTSVLQALYGAVLDCRALVFPTIHLFSTRIANISLAELRAGKCESTGGTDIGCVAEHMATHRVSRALFITDGWTGKPCGQHLDILSRARLAVAYLGTNVNQTDLQSVANHTAILTTGA
jgi:hypothetical protein